VAVAADHSEPAVGVCVLCGGPVSAAPPAGFQARTRRRTTALGLDRRSLLEVMKHSSGSNWFADNIDQIDWSDEGYSLDNTIGIVEKDVLASLDTVSESPDIDRWPLDDGLLDALRRLEPLELESATR